ncbi:hypothetical protein [Geothrix paludis]|uniref:hypothetical protein n=1 Tax=Geothrix paludis TaxID=2922722 RepID=UPI001FACE4AE|nr:hypothetical protein [Geothrix paludis]
MIQGAYDLAAVLPWYLDFIEHARPPVHERATAGPHGNRARAFAYVARAMPEVLAFGEGQTCRDEMVRQLRQAIVVLAPALASILVQAMEGESRAEGAKRAAFLFEAMAACADPCPLPWLALRTLTEDSQRPGTDGAESSERAAVES